MADMEIINETSLKLTMDDVYGVGVDDYEALSDKPKINGIEVSGSKSLDDYGIASKADASAAKADAGLKAMIDANTTDINHLKLYVTPEMYGAVGDGITDDTNAFLDAIASGYSVLISKTYRIGTITTFRDCRLIGIKNNKIIIDVPDTTKQFPFKISGSGLIENVNFEMSRNHATTDGVNSLIGVIDASNVIFDRCSFTSINLKTSSPLDIYSNSNNILVINCTFNYSSSLEKDGGGIMIRNLNDSQTTQTFNVYFVNCYINANSDDEVIWISTDTKNALPTKNIYISACTIKQEDSSRTNPCIISANGACENILISNCNIELSLYSFNTVFKTMDTDIPNALKVDNCNVEINAISSHVTGLCSDGILVSNTTFTNNTENTCNIYSEARVTQYRGCTFNGHFSIKGNSSFSDCTFKDSAQITYIFIDVFTGGELSFYNCIFDITSNTLFVNLNSAAPDATLKLINCQSFNTTGQFLWGRPEGSKMYIIGNILYGAAPGNISTSSGIIANNFTNFAFPSASNITASNNVTIS